VLGALVAIVHGTELRAVYSATYKLAETRIAKM
jgi:hypothetical protein